MTTFEKFNVYNTTYGYDDNYTLTFDHSLDPDDIKIDKILTALGVLCPDHLGKDMAHVLAISYWIREVISTTVGVFGIIGNILAIVVLREDTHMTSDVHGERVQNKVKRLNDK